MRFPGSALPFSDFALIDDIAPIGRLHQLFPHNFLQFACKPF